MRVDDLSAFRDSYVYNAATQKFDMITLYPESL